MGGRDTEVSTSLTNVPSFRLLKWKAEEEAGRTPPVFEMFSAVKSNSFGFINRGGSKVFPRQPPL